MHLNIHHQVVINEICNTSIYIYIYIYISQLSKDSEFPNIIYHYVDLRLFALDFLI